VVVKQLIEKVRTQPTVLYAEAYEYIKREYGIHVDDSKIFRALKQRKLWNMQEFGIMHMNSTNYSALIELKMGTLFWFDLVVILDVNSFVPFGSYFGC
jgi:hypothetical protein